MHEGDHRFRHGVESKAERRDRHRRLAVGRVPLANLRAGGEMLAGAA